MLLIQKILQESFLSVFNNRHYLRLVMLMQQCWFTVKTSC